MVDYAAGSEIFAEFSDIDDDRRVFMATFKEAAGDLALKFVAETGEELISPEGVPFPVPKSHSFFEEARNSSSCFVWSSGVDFMVAGINLPALKGCLLCAVPGTVSEDVLWNRVLQTALRFCQVKQEIGNLIAENGQLCRHIEALKQQYSTLVENNHLQYLQLRDKEKEYAKKLECEIAAQTAKLRKTNEELAEASRLKSEFVANMSHELRTPLGAILGFSELLAETELDAIQSEYAKTINQSGSGLLHLIDDILDFTKIEADRLDIDRYPFNLSDIVRNACAMFEKPSSEKGLDFHLHLDEMLPVEFIGDGNRIKQVLVNLAGNAVKFTERGEIKLRVDLVGQRGDDLAVKFSVSDTGLGIAQDRQEAVFGKFVQADGAITRQYGGTGLGLAISSKLVALMGGQISLQSELGRGSTFSFTLFLPPANYGRKIGFPAATKTLSSSWTRGLLRSGTFGDFGGETKGAKTILLVEDNIVNQKLATVLIRKKGFDVVVAEDGLAALGKLKGQRFDLIFMDLQMPNMGGIEATRKIREIENSSQRSQYIGLNDASRRVPIVGLSAHARKEDAEESMAAGMDDFLTKPIVREKLEEVLKRVLNA